MSLSDMRMKTLLPILLMTSYCLAQSGGLLNATRGIPQPNDSTTGTILNGTAIVNAAGNAAIAQIGNTTVPVRIVIGGAGTTGNAVLASTGTLAPCTMDATLASAGNAYVIESVLNPGQCHPQTTTPGTGVWVIGYVHDPATTQNAAALVHVNGFIYGGSGGGGLPPGMSYTAPTLTLAPSGTTSATLALGGGTSGTSTITAPGSAGNQAASIVFSNGVQLPSSGLLAWGTPDLNLTRGQNGFLRLGNGSTSNENGLLGSANACALAAPAPYSAPTSPTNPCYRNIPLVSRSWIVQCVFPFSYTSGSGATTTTFSIVIGSSAPTAVSTFVSSIWGPSTAPTYNAVTIPTTANTTTQLITHNTTLTDTATYAVRIDGVVNAGGGAINLQATISNGAAQLLSGGYCRYE